MRIDERVEARVRESFGAVLDRDGNRMTAAFEGLDESDSELAIRLGVYVVGFVMNDAFREGPAAADAHATARDIIESEGSWVDVGTPDEVANFLLSAARSDITFPGVPKEDLVGLTFVCGAYLLGTRRLESQQWFEYLDQIWAVLEAAPEPGQ
jgi:hypothetical protein